MSLSTCSFCPGGQEIPLLLNTTLPDFLTEYKTCQDAFERAKNESLFLPQDSSDCRVLQTVGVLCGCPGTVDGCTLCPDNHPVEYADKTIDFISNDTFGFVPTCEFEEAYLKTLSQNESICQSMEEISAHCGCPYLPTLAKEECRMCDNDIPQEKLGMNVGFLGGRTPEYLGPPEGIEETCEYVKLRTRFVEQFDHTGRTDECSEVVRRGLHCGCNDSWHNKAGYSTLRQKRIFISLMVLAATLTLIGSVMVMVDILRDKKKRKLYHQIMLGMVIFDFITGLAFVMGPLPVPQYWDGDPTVVLGAHGTTGTCMTQGFFVQLGLGTIFYNVSLTMYYKLVIVDGWRADRLQKYRIWFHVIPSMIAVGLALGAIPFYGPFVGHCHLNLILVPVESGANLHVGFLYFLYGPLFLSIVILGVITMKIFLSVKSTANQSSRWTPSAVVVRLGQSNQEQEERPRSPFTLPRDTFGQSQIVRKVFWQSLCYLLAVGIIWPYNFCCVYLTMVHPLLRPGFGFIAVSVFLTPLQGFLNALVYFRPRVMTWYAERAAARKRRPTDISRSPTDDDTRERQASSVPSEDQSAEIVFAVAAP